MSLIGIVRRTLQRHHLATSSTRVVTALSGGPDSMALLHLLRHLHDAGELRLVGVAHLDHQLRATAPSDARFSASIAESFSLPFVLERVDVRAAAAERHRSLEDAAHAVRHEFYARAVAACGADTVAVGHTRDDQAETFLLRLVRGAGSRGLAAMHPKNGIVIRPLLDCSRGDLRAFLQEAGIPFVHDESNDDVGIPRNRVRAELLPLLKERFNPQVVDALAAAADLARADEELIAGLAAEWVDAHVRAGDAGQRWIPVAPALAAPGAVARRAIHQVMSHVADGRLIGHDHVTQTWAVMVGEAQGFDAPGQRVEREGRYVVLTGRPGGSAGRRSTASVSTIPAFCHHLPVPGEVAIPEIGCVMSAEVLDSAENEPAPNGVTAVVPKQMVAGGLTVRNRRPGDRLRPTAAGHRKLQDLLVDRKVPRGLRDRVPIVLDVEGRIVWVAGHAQDRDFQVTDPAQAVVILRLKGVGGSC